ncbi:MAG TPA: ECF transporter S component [Treponemataceae bacterium]|nr:ECF transporter S component [Treponemataceae bacterium]
MNNTTGAYIRKLVITGALGSLAIFLGITRLGFFPWISGATITILHIPAILGAVLEGPFVGAGIGAIFGVFSLLQANIAPVTPIDVAFRNPLVSVLPRVLFPLVAWGAYALIARWRKLPAAAFGAIVGTIAHTALVLGMLIATAGSGALTGGEPPANVWPILGVIFVANGIPEAIAAAVLTVLVVVALRGAGSVGRKSKLSKE